METMDGHITVLEAVRLTGWTRKWIYDLCVQNRVINKKRTIGRMAYVLIDKQSLLDYCEKQGRPVNGQPS